MPSDSSLSGDDDDEVPVCKITLFAYMYTLCACNLQIVGKTILISDADEIHNFSGREVCYTTICGISLENISKQDWMYVQYVNKCIGQYIKMSIFKSCVIAMWL